MLRIFFALWLAVSPAFAWAGSMTLLGVGKVGSTTVSNWCNLIPQSGLVNCWPYDTANTTTGTAIDVIGGKNSTQTAVTLNGSGPSSNLNNAAVFNGTSSKGDTSLLNVPTTAFSVVMWIKSTNLASGNRIFANSHTDFSAPPGFEIMFNNSTFAQCWVADNSGTNAVADTPTITSGSWAMISFTWNGTTLTPYTNTTAGTTSTYGSIVGTPSVNLSFGYNPVYSGDFYNGMISGTAIYNRALTSGEIATINAL